MFVLDEDSADMQEVERPHQAAMDKHYVGILSGPGVQSGNRLAVMLALLKYQPSGVFWPVFHETWDHCDGTWGLRHWLAADLRRHNERRLGATYLRGDNRAWLDSLPDPVRVFRGCSRERVKGVSWTTDREIADGFAYGHRGIRVPRPVIASGLAAKRTIYAAYVERKEAEVVLDPEALTGLTANKFGR
jgi:hypothetical protein